MQSINIRTTLFYLAFSIASSVLMVTESVHATIGDFFPHGTVYNAATYSKATNGIDHPSFFGHTDIYYVVDINVGSNDCGLPLLAPENGGIVTVVETNTNGWGNAVTWSRGEETIFLAHLSKFGKVGSVCAGETIGYIGTTSGGIASSSTGCHLHIEHNQGRLILSGHGIIPGLEYNGPEYISKGPYSGYTIFNFNNNTLESWKAGNSIHYSRLENNKWEFETWKDPNVLSPVFYDIDTLQFKYFELLMTIKQNQWYLKPYFTEKPYIYYDDGSGINFSEQKKIGLGWIIPNGANLYFRENFEYSGTINQLRLDPVESHPEGMVSRVSIDFFRLVSSSSDWDFESGPMGWTLENAYWYCFRNSWAECFSNKPDSLRWNIQSQTGSPQAVSPWLGEINTTRYRSLNLRYSVNRDTNSNGEKLNAYVCFDMHDDDINDFSQQTLCWPYKVTPDSQMHEYEIPLPCTGLGHCQKIYRVRIQFYQGSDTEIYKVELDDIEFSEDYVDDFPDPEGYCSANPYQSLKTDKSHASFESSLTLSQKSSSENTYVIIQKIQNLQVSDNTAVDIRATASGSCGDCYNWSLIENPLNLSISESGHISGNSGGEAGVYTFVVRAEDQDFPGNYAEAEFSITVGDELATNSLRIFNDGVGPLQITGLTSENGSNWLDIRAPYEIPFTIEGGGHENIYVSVNQQILSSGTYTDTVIISSNDENDDRITVPVSITIDGDTEAPSAPENMSVSPGSWFSSGSVEINWDNPPDPSGIAGYWYKIGSPPTSESDGIFSTEKPLILTPNEPGSQTVFVWLEDEEGNSNYHNIAAATYYYDAVLPIITAQYPGIGSTEVPVDSEITIQVEEAHSGVDTQTMEMTVNDVEVSPTITSDFGYTYISYQPNESFSYNETVTVSLELTDQSSPANAFQKTSWSFTTQAEATSPSLYSFTINNNADSTTNPQVTLNSVAFGSPTAYKASELEDLSDATWQPYQEELPFTLSEGNENKTVYFKVRNSIGESNVVSDSITLTTNNSNCETVEINASGSKNLYDPPAETSYRYRYGPSIILEGTTVNLWASAPDPSSAVWDRIEHRRGQIDSNGDIQWETDWTSVLEATPGSRDKYSACDPGVFYYDEYYYIGYTSTDQSVGAGATSNDIFIARFNALPDGSSGNAYEKWNGSGWGDDPEPIIEYNGDGWGKGQPSFVVKNDQLFIYYTDGGTKVLIIDLLDENWPNSIDEANAEVIFTNGNARDIYGGKPGPFEVKYIDDLSKFIGIAVSNEFRLEGGVDNYIFVCESGDGITFTPVAKSKDYWGALVLGDGSDGGAHNIGISGDREGHIDLNATNFFAYGYGLSQMVEDQPHKGRWPTYLNKIAIESIPCELEADFFAEPKTGQAPLTVQFHDQSKGDISSWFWVFGDENTSSEQNPEHTYSDSGDYTVKLTVTGDDGSDDVKERAEYIQVGPNATSPILAANPGYHNVSSDAGSTMFEVSNDGAGTMEWTATTQEDWISITSGASGSNTGTISISYEANVGSVRTGEITVSESSGTCSPIVLYVNQASPANGQYTHSYTVACKGKNESDGRHYPIGQSIIFDQNETVYVLTELKDVSVRHRYMFKQYINGAFNTEWIEQTWHEFDGATCDYSYFWVRLEFVAYGEHRIEMYIQTQENDFQLFHEVNFEVQRVQPLFGAGSTLNFDDEKNGFDLIDYSPNQTGIIGIDSEGGINGTPCLLIENTEIQDEHWIIKPALIGLDLSHGEYYSLSMKMKAENDCDIIISLDTRAAPYGDEDENLGFARNVKVRTKWNEFRYVFRANLDTLQPLLENISLSINIGKMTGKLWVDDVSLSINEVSQIPFFQNFENGLGSFVKEDPDLKATELKIIPESDENGGNALYISNGQASEWHEIQVKKIGFNLQSNTNYKVSLKIKGENEGEFAFLFCQEFDVDNNEVWSPFSPWWGSGLCPITREWQIWESDTFQTSNNPENEQKNIRGSIQLGRTTGWVLIDDIVIGKDSDNDGLMDHIEDNIPCLDKNDADTDDDGILDGEEDRNHNGVVDHNETNPCKKDTDGDGIQDGTEVGLTVAHIGTDTDLGIFISDADPDPTANTNPLLDDTDDDGFLDGDEDRNANGRVDIGESDPNNNSSVPQSGVKKSMPWLFLLLE